MEDLEDLVLDSSQPDKILKISNQLSSEDKNELFQCLIANSDLFAWCHDDMKCLNPEVMVYGLDDVPNFKLETQKKRSFVAERNHAAKKEVEKLLQDGFIRVVQYPK